MIVVLTGHRLDPPDAVTPRFPVSRVDDVADRLSRLFALLRPDCVVAAAAGGADLLGLEAARRGGIRTVVALPLPRVEFRRRSVDDQGEEMLARFGPALDAAAEVVEADLSDRDDWYLVGNDVILDVAAAEAGDDPVLVVAVRSGEPSATDDLVDRASRRGWPCVDLDPSTSDAERPRLDTTAGHWSAVLALAALDLDVEVEPSVEPGEVDLADLEAARERVAELLAGQSRR